ncbi:hypothetical protein AGLY_003485 [Aphis glycines]|uniref:DDE Tnp4 domain-containing protein n=1 Tax=Aphis glycines TaxID=307491 RepID=A0A6G0TZR9_APHGL|nr:hypothetical protein AGLY_003485 [Aphis glycines]
MEHFLNLNYIQAIHNLEIMEERQDTIRLLVGELRSYLEPPSRKSAISIERKASQDVLTALRFFTSGSYQQDIGENRASFLSQFSIGKCITEVCDTLNMFTNVHGIPGVIDIIDCTHIAIVSPKADGPYLEHIYEKLPFHKRVTSKSIRNIKSCYTIIEQMNNEGMCSYYLLGDSGYALRLWLMTPLNTPDPNTPEGRYNEWFCKSRSLIERTELLSPKNDLLRFASK